MRYSLPKNLSYLTLCRLVSLVQSNVSLNRISQFLDEPDTAKWSILASDAARTPRIGFEHATLAWPGQPIDDGLVKVVPPDFALENLDLNFPIGKLSLITGPVGSGKTALLLSLLGEMRLVSGRVFLPTPLFRSEQETFEMADAVAYCAQSPYLLSDTIKANILFGTPWHSQRYRQVLEACALLPDLASLDNGEETEVGERGASSVIRPSVLRLFQELCSQVVKKLASVWRVPYTAMLGICC